RMVDGVNTANGTIRIVYGNEMPTQPPPEVALHPIVVGGYVSSSDNEYSTGGTETEARGLSTPTRFADTTDSQNPEIRTRYMLDAEISDSTDDDALEAREQDSWNWWRTSYPDDEPGNPIFRNHTETQWHEWQRTARRERVYDRRRSRAERDDLQSEMRHRHRFNAIMRARTRARMARIRASAPITPRRNGGVEETMNVWNLEETRRAMARIAEEIRLATAQIDAEQAEEADDEETEMATIIRQRTEAGETTRAETRARHTQEFQLRNTSDQRVAYIRHEAILRNITNSRRYDMEQLRVDMTILQREYEEPRSTVNILNNMGMMLWWAQPRRFVGNLLTRMLHDQYKRRLIREENRQIIEEKCKSFDEVQTRRLRATVPDAFGVDNWQPTDEQIDEHPWVMNWRWEAPDIIHDRTPGNTHRFERNPPIDRHHIPGTYRQTPNVKEWREDTIRAINLNAEERGTELLIGPPPGYTIEYESDHSSDNEDLLPNDWYPGEWCDKGTIGLRWSRATPPTMEYNGMEAHACEVGIPIRVIPRDLLRADTDSTLLDDYLEANPWAELR
nr:hypothetical protein [Dehalococcoidia bacterium]